MQSKDKSEYNLKEKSTNWQRKDLQVQGRGVARGGEASAVSGLPSRRTYKKISCHLITIAENTYAYRVISA